MKNEKKAKMKLLWDFLRGSKRYFLLAILSAAVTALADMLNPQIIRAAVDNAIGGKEADFPGFVMELVEKLGGFAIILNRKYTVLYLPKTPECI